MQYASQPPTSNHGVGLDILDRAIDRRLRQLEAKATGRRLAPVYDKDMQTDIVAEDSAVWLIAMTIMGGDLHGDAVETLSKMLILMESRYRWMDTTVRYSNREIVESIPGWEWYDGTAPLPPGVHQAKAEDALCMTTNATFSCPFESAIPLLRTKRGLLRCGHILLSEMHVSAVFIHMVEEQVRGVLNYCKLNIDRRFTFVDASPMLRGIMRAISGRLDKMGYGRSAHAGSDGARTSPLSYMLDLKPFPISLVVPPCVAKAHYLATRADGQPREAKDKARMLLNTFMGGALGASKQDAVDYWKRAFSKTTEYARTAVLHLKKKSWHPNHGCSKAADFCPFRARPSGAESGKRASIAVGYVDGPLAGKMIDETFASSATYVGRCVAFMAKSAGIDTPSTLGMSATPVRLALEMWQRQQEARASEE